MPNTETRKDALKRLAPAIENAAVVLSEESDVQVVSQSATNKVVSLSGDTNTDPLLAKVVSLSTDEPA